MKISVNWMKWYGGQGLDVPTDELVKRIGSQLGEVEGVEDLGAKYQGVVVAKVVKCDEHPNADKLHVCTIDDRGITPDVKRDGDGHVQVVCGAPNVRAGMLVAWLPPGATVPDSVGKDPFVLEARELRGVVSNGMLASPKELALGDSHEGLLELDGDAKPGDDFAKAYGLDDTIIEIENKMFTHRPDCFGQLGVAREIAGIQGLQFKSPDWYLNVLQDVLNVDGQALPLVVRNEIPTLVPRFMAITMSDITIKPSPVWLQTHLQRVGVRPINNIVDITNFFMLETGQPSHAYDYDKVKALDGGDTATIVVRNPRANERVTLLNGKTIDPRQEAIVIASDKQLIGLGGVMGGSETEVDDSTRNIILEVASFDMYSIRRTSMAHGLFTDAVTRFNKGQSPLQNKVVIAKLVEEVRRWADGKVASELVDFNSVEGRASVHPPVPVTAEFINARLGLELSADDMKKLLENVEFQVAVEADALTVTAPFWRTDVETREDVVEEVGRLYGFDKLPHELPQRSIKPAVQDQLLKLKSVIRAKLAKAGANEVLTYSFVHGNLLDKVGQDKSLAFSLSNALSPDLQYYRLSLTPSLLEKVHPNAKTGYGEFALFEIGMAHGQGEVDDEGLPKGLGRVSFVYANAAKHKVKAPYYQARRFATELLHDFVDTTNLRFVPVAEAAEKLPEHKLFQQMLAVFDLRRAAVLFNGEQPLGVVGEYKPAVMRALKLPADCAGFELFLSAFSKSLGTQYQPLSRFPSVWQDITLKLPTTTSYQQVYETVIGSFQTPEAVRYELEPLGIYQSEEDTTNKNISLRLRVTSYERTLTDGEVNAMLDTATRAAESIGAHRV